MSLRYDLHHTVEDVAFYFQSYQAEFVSCVHLMEDLVFKLTVGGEEGV